MISDSYIIYQIIYLTNILLSLILAIFCLLWRFEVSVYESLWPHVVQILHPLRSLVRPAHGMRCSVVRLRSRSMENCRNGKRDILL